MTKVKVSKDVANFIDDYARNMTHNENWKDKLLIDHSITYSRGFDAYNEKLKVLKNITPMKLAEILHNGWEVESICYDKTNIPRKFKIKVNTSYYTAKIINEEVILMWKNLDDEFDCINYDLRDVIALLNDGIWDIIFE